MDDRECVELLRWALPELGLRYAGLSNVRGQVRKRIARRIKALGLDGARAYRGRLEADPAEWRELEGLCRITITRFYRDRGVFEALERRVLPELARGARSRGSLSAWSAGCCGGEEPYSLVLLWLCRGAEIAPELELRVLATDADPEQLERARRGRYAGGALRDLPPELLTRGFAKDGESWVLRDEVKSSVELRVQDLRVEQPPGPFDLVLCRNLAFTYFDEPWQIRIANDIAERLVPRGTLVIGKHERLPGAVTCFEPMLAHEGIFTKA